MSQLRRMSPEDQELIVSLPYRVGVWLSYADDEGGDDDDELEMEALENTLKSIAGNHTKSAFVSEVINETLALKNRWGDWQDRIFNIESDVEKAMRLLVANLNESDWKPYRGMLVRIGRTVAESYGEFGEDEEEEIGFFGKLVGKITSGNGSSEEAAHMNISASENAALSSLAKALSAGSK